MRELLVSCGIYAVAFSVIYITLSVLSASNNASSCPLPVGRHIFSALGLCSLESDKPIQGTSGYSVSHRGTTFADSTSAYDSAAEDEPSYYGGSTYDSTQDDPYNPSAYGGDSTEDDPYNPSAYGGDSTEDDPYNPSAYGGDSTEDDPSYTGGSTYDSTEDDPSYGGSGYDSTAEDSDDSDPAYVSTSGTGDSDFSHYDQSNPSQHSESEGQNVFEWKVIIDMEAMKAKDVNLTEFIVEVMATAGINETVNIEELIERAEMKVDEYGNVTAIILHFDDERAANSVSDAINKMREKDCERVICRTKRVRIEYSQRTSIISAGHQPVINVAFFISGAVMFILLSHS